MMIDRVRKNFIQQAAYCSNLGSPFYAALLPSLAECLDESALVYSVLSNWSGDPHDDAVALRFVAALNFLVITRQAPQLDLMFASAAAPENSHQTEAIRDTLREHQEFIINYLALPPQTNEVGRSAVLLGGFLEVARRYGDAMELFEVGASAGLNLFFDQYSYESKSWSWGNNQAAVKCKFDWRGEVPKSATIQVVDRHACDQSPVDLNSEGNRLLSYVWPDQTSRVARLKAAIAQVCDSTISIDRIGAADWLNLKLKQAVPMHTRVFYHSIVWQYLSSEEQTKFIDGMDRLAATATPQSPLVWLRLEPAADKPCAELRMKSWPGGEDRLLAQSSFHGDWVEWLGAEVSQ